MVEAAAQLDAISRQVRRDPETVTAILRRDLDAHHDAVWDAITDADELSKWFSAVGGQLHEGGVYQIEGGPSGEIWECKPRQHFMLTVGDSLSLLTVELGSSPDATIIQLTHGIPISRAGSGAGALLTGPGWDLALLGLVAYLGGEALDMPIEVAKSDELTAFATSAIERWAEVVSASGTATAEEIRQAREAATERFVAAH